MCTPTRRTRWTPQFLAASLLLSVVLGIAPLLAQGTQAVVELWRTLDARFIGVSMDLGPFDDVFEVGYTTVGDIIVTKKLDRDGNLLWERIFDPPERLKATWIAADPFDNAFVSGYTFTGSSTPTGSGLLTLKYDSQGTLLWSDRIQGSFAQTVRVETDAAGNAYVAGRLWMTNPSGFISLDFAVVKYAPDGRRLWVRTFDNAGAADDATSLAVTPAGRVAVAGRSGQSALVVVYDTNGNLAWSFTRADIGTAWDVAFGPSGEVVAGASIWTPQTSIRMALLKFNAAGQPQWIRTYPVGDYVIRVAVDSLGNVAATGVDSAMGTSHLNWSTFKTDPAGTLLWSRRRDAHTVNDEFPYFITIDPFNAIYVTGQSGPGPSIGLVSVTRMATVKYASDGTQQWAATAPGIGRGLAARIASDDTVFVFGDFMFTARYRETGLPDLPPIAPTALTAAPTFNGAEHGMNLSWSDNSDNEFYVEIERCTGANCTNFVNVGRTTGEDAPGFRDRPLAAGTTYTYRVRAVGSAGRSAYSNSASGSTITFTVPAAPSQLTATRTGDFITLRWTDNSTDELQFPIERCQGGGCTDFMQVNAADANATEFVDFSTQPGQTYSYRVRAWNSGGYSGYSNVATVGTGTLLPPAAPTALQAGAVSRTAIQLQWLNGGSVQDGVVVERCRGSSCTAFAVVGQAPGNTMLYLDSGLRSKTFYTYRVRSFNAGGFSPYSNVASARTR